MQKQNDSKEKDYASGTGHPSLNDKQQQTDPNLTELKGFTDSSVPLEPTADQTKAKDKEEKKENK